ncbi:hypothetical protein [Pararhodobacter zhoushanensis]|uniref:Uncharacterized protein n=1 Tax=Pararhodobacter zhoushanensis TaxID=2479545 RepID=A0ABT3GU95_9RHOB|nr:hypothetical protein [Pararhodobacter zhoushanensis]MCW1931084.1 hypothetical protein [Pararhodobacter zhoushanensis]
MRGRAALISAAGVPCCAGASTVDTSVCATTAGDASAAAIDAG